MKCPLHNHRCEKFREDWKCLFQYIAIEKLIIIKTNLISSNIMSMVESLEFSLVVKGALLSGDGFFFLELKIKDINK